MLLLQYLMLQIPSLQPAHDAAQMNRLHETQTEAQRTIAKHVGAYPLWISGEVDESRWDDLVRKFSELYETDISASARQWRKRRNACCAHLIGAPLPRGKIRWILMVTADGEGEVKRRERLRDAHDARMVWGDYMLVRATRASALGGGTRWTWFLAPQVEHREARYLAKVAQTAATHRQPSQLSAFADTLLKRPLHSGVRQQVARMLRRAQRVWMKHAKGMPWPGPDPGALPHIGRYRQVIAPQG